VIFILTNCCGATFFKKTNNPIWPHGQGRSDLAATFFSNTGEPGLSQNERISKAGKGMNVMIM